MFKTIQTPIGAYRYRFVPLFQGIKYIDKTIARENLLLFKDICISHQLPFILFFGTLLGAVREHDFITHDEDIDLAMMKRDMPRFLSILFELRKYGFEMIRYEERGFLSIMRKGEYIDIYFYEEYPAQPNLYYCCRDIFPKEILDNLIDYPFLGTYFKAPEKYEKYLEFYFGDNWQTPIVAFNYHQPLWSKVIEYIKQYSKELLPTTWIRKRQIAGDRPILEKWIERIEHFNF